MRVSQRAQLTRRRTAIFAPQIVPQWTRSTTRIPSRSDCQKGLNSGYHHPSLHDESVDNQNPMHRTSSLCIGEKYTGRGQRRLVLLWFMGLIDKTSLMYKFSDLYIVTRYMPAGNLVSVVCIKCKSPSPISSPSHVCKKCGGRLQVVLDLESAKESLTKQSLERSGMRGVWRYEGLLPILNRKTIISLGEGNTDLRKTDSLSQVLGFRSLYVKDETTNPSGAFVDRGMTVEISRARALGFGAAAGGWSGNLASSLAAYCARGGMRSRAYVQADIDFGKLYQAVAYGAEIVPCYSATEANQNLIENQDKYYPVTARNAFFLEGVKTTGIEIVEQLNWHPPDWLVIPMGNGSHLAMTLKGLREIADIGLIRDAGTRLVGVQVEGCSPIVDSMKGDTRERGAERPATIAWDIAIREPKMGNEAVAAMKESNGVAIAVTEAEILDAVELLARSEGLFAEPASASPVAAVRRMLEDGTMLRSETVVCIITGTGLKDPLTARAIACKNKAARDIISRYEDAFTEGG